MNRAHPLLMAALAAAAACERAPEPITEPRQLTESPFQYPEELWDAGVQGKTTLRIYITAAGGVDSVRVDASSGHAAFDSSATAGARELRFEPARQGDQAVGVWRTLPVEFALDVPPADSAAPTDTAATP